MANKLMAASTSSIILIKLIRLICLINLFCFSDTLEGFEILYIMRKVYIGVIKAGFQPYSLPCQNLNELAIIMLAYLNK